MPFRVQVQLFFSGELVVSQRFADVGDESSTRMTTLCHYYARKKQWSCKEGVANVSECKLVRCSEYVVLLLDCRQV